jgi:hypothetical protein
VKDPCYCGHEKARHKGGACKAKNDDGTPCECPTFDRAPSQDDEPGEFLEVPKWK